MTNDERPGNTDIASHAARMHSAIAYRRMKAIVEGWAHEERAKRKVAVQSIAWLAIIWTLTIPVGLLSGGSFLESLFFGFLFWVVVHIVLMREYLPLKNDP